MRDTSLLQPCPTKIVLLKLYPDVKDEIRVVDSENFLYAIRVDCSLLGLRKFSFDVPMQKGGLAYHAWVNNYYFLRLELSYNYCFAYIFIIIKFIFNSE